MEMQTNSCPCCGDYLLRHIRHGGVYWFCTSCGQEVPLLTVRQVPGLENLTLSKPVASTKRSRLVQPVNSSTK